MTRKNKVQLFNNMVIELLLFAKYNNISYRFAEAWRSEKTCREYAKKGIGIINSKHRKSLAIDLWITSKGWDIIWTHPDYKKLGNFWRSIGGIWGGDFKKPDPYHFEFYL